MSMVKTCVRHVVKTYKGQNLRDSDIVDEDFCCISCMGPVIVRAPLDPDGSGKGLC